MLKIVWSSVDCHSLSYCYCTCTTRMVRKCKWLVEALLPLGVQLLCEVEHEEAWAGKIDATNSQDMLDDGDELEEVGARVIDGIAKVLQRFFALVCASFLVVREHEIIMWA